ncbi:MAG: hypothetical protein AAFV01_09975 [Bacteroidota bacterium]
MSRSNVQSIQLGPLVDPHPGSESAGGAVALTRAENIRPVRRDDGVEYYEVVANPKRILAAANAGAGVAGILDAYREIRQRPVSDDAAGPAAALDRWIVLASDNVAPETITAYVAADDGATSLLLHTCPTVDPTRRMVCVPYGRYTLAIVTTGDRTAPVSETALLLTDDGALPFGPLPVANGFTSTSDAGELPRGRALVGFAPMFRGGARGPITHMQAASRDGDWGLRVAPFGDQAEPSAYAHVAAEQDFWNAEVVGVAVYVAFLAAAGSAGREMPSWEEVGQQPFNEVATYLRDLGETPTNFTERIEEPPVTEGTPARFDNLLAAARPNPTCALRYNGRAVLGGVAWTFAPPPVVMFDDWGDNTGNASDFALLVELELRGQTVTVWQTFSAELSAAGDKLRCRGGLLFYPDQRATRFSIHRVTDTETGAYRVTPIATFDAVRPRDGNFAMARVSDADWIDPLAVDDWETIDHVDPVSALAFLPGPVTDPDANRLAATHPGRTWELRASTVVEVGDSPDDAILAIRAQTEAPSEGQYGSAPLVVGCHRSVWALDLSADAEAFLRARVPLSVGRGIASPDALLSVGRGLVGADAQELRAYLPAPEPRALSASLSASLAPILERAALGWLTTPDGDEIWCAAADGSQGRVYAYSVQAGQWYTRTLRRCRFIRAAGQLYGLDPEGELWQEDTLATTVDAHIESHPMYLSTRGARVRIYTLRFWQEPRPDQLRPQLFERVMRYQADDGSDLADEGAGPATIASDPFLETLDGATFENPYGSLVAPRLLLSITGRLMQRVGQIDLQVSERGRRRLRSGTRRYVE